MAAAPEHTPWYRVPLMWLVILFPLTAVIGGVITLRLAVLSDDGLVEDDYYQRGKQINRVLARDRAAASRKLSAKVTFDYSSRIIRLAPAAAAGTQLPAQLHLKLLHATRSGFDREVELNRTADGTYQGLFTQLAPGRWHVQLEADDWRLVGSLNVPEQSQLVLAPAL